MAITKRTLILALLGSAVAGLLARASLGDQQRASASELHISPSICAAGAQDWLAQPNWPADEVLLGDQIYTRKALWNLSHSNGNPVADLGLSLAAAQLNLAAGAKPNVEVVDALFEADLWLLDNHEEDRRSQNESASLLELSDVLNDFNRWAADTAMCTYST